VRHFASCAFAAVISYASSAVAQGAAPDVAVVALPPQPHGFFARQRGFSSKFEAGPTVRRIFRVPVYGIDLGLALGSQTRIGAFYGTLGGLIGATNLGLIAKQFAAGVAWEAPIGAFRLGIGLRSTLFGIERVSTDNTMWGLGGGAIANATYDLYEGEEHAVYLGVKAGADFLDGDDLPILWGGSAIFGVRTF
jgi:hypothetical protein